MLKLVVRDASSYANGLTSPAAEADSRTHHHPATPADRETPDPHQPGLGDVDTALLPASTVRGGDLTSLLVNLFVCSNRF